MEIKAVIDPTTDEAFIATNSYTEEQRTMTGKEIGDQLGFYSSLFTPDQLSELAKGNDVEQEVPSGMFADMYTKAEELEGVSIPASTLFVDDDGVKEKCSGLGVKVVCFGGGDCCLYVRMKKIIPPKPVFKVCCA
jgi:hypothetical protein